MLKLKSPTPTIENPVPEKTKTNHTAARQHSGSCHPRLCPWVNTRALVTLPRLCPWINTRPRKIKSLAKFPPWPWRRDLQATLKER
jgi:hypothetical protein